MGFMGDDLHLTHERILSNLNGWDVFKRYVVKMNKKHLRVANNRVFSLILFLKYFKSQLFIIFIHTLDIQQRGFLLLHFFHPVHSIYCHSVASLSNRFRYSYTWVEYVENIGRRNDIRLFNVYYFEFIFIYFPRLGPCQCHCYPPNLYMLEKYSLWIFVFDINLKYIARWMDGWMVETCAPWGDEQAHRRMQGRKYENIIINNFYFYYRSFISNNLT